MDIKTDLIIKSFQRGFIFKMIAKADHSHHFPVAFWLLLPLLKLGIILKVRLDKMQNEAGEYVDLYIPRKCSASNRIIGAGDHASIQINIAEVDEKTGRMTGTNKTYAICGKIRGMGESDDSILRLAKKDGITAS
jgi:small subunit ribosomal protein S21e